MSRRRTATVVVEPKIVVVSGWNVGELLKVAGLRPLYVGTRRGFVLDRRRLPDILAALDHQGIAASVTEAGDAA